MATNDQPYMNEQPYVGPAVQPTESVGKGLLFATGGVLIGIALTVGIWKLGFIASITAFVLSAAAVFLYQMGSGGVLAKGRVPLILLIIVGTIAAFFACIAMDISDYYTDNAPPGALISRWEFIADMITDPEVIGSYTKEFLLFLLFAGLGAFGTIRGLVSKSKPGAPVDPSAPPAQAGNPPAAATYEPYASTAPAPEVADVPPAQPQAPDAQNPPTAPDQWAPPPTA